MVILLIVRSSANSLQNSSLNSTRDSSPNSLRSPDQSPNWSSHRLPHWSPLPKRSPYWKLDSPTADWLPEILEADWSPNWSTNWFMDWLPSLIDRSSLDWSPTSSLPHFRHLLLCSVSLPRSKHDEAKVVIYTVKLAFKELSYNQIPFFKKDFFQSFHNHILLTMHWISII